MASTTSEEGVDPQLQKDYGDFARYYIDDLLVRDDPPLSAIESKPTRKRGLKRTAKPAGESPGSSAKKQKPSSNNLPPRRSARNSATVAEDADGDGKQAVEIPSSTKHNKDIIMADPVPASQPLSSDEESAVNALMQLQRPVLFAQTPLPAPNSRRPWSGTPSGHGTSQEKPPATIHPSQQVLTTPWNCAETDCATGFTWAKRDGADGVGRKAISQFFGRNKKETASIHVDVWHIYCRKHYQRHKYAIDAMDPAGRCHEQVTSLRTQLERIKLWRPNATFTVQFTKAMIDRMRHWDTCLAKTNNDVVNAQTLFNIRYPVNNAKGSANTSLEATFPRALVDTFRNNHTGNNFSFTRMASVLDWIDNNVNAGALTVMPPMEFLISELSATEVGVTDPTNNYYLWLASLP